MILAMSEAVQLEIVRASAIVIPVLIGAFVAWINLRKTILELSASTKKEMAEVKADVKVIEKATNSMKDALVDATKTAGLLEGADNERNRAQAENAAIAADRKEQADAASQPTLPAAPGMSELHEKVETTTKTLVKRVDKAEEAIKKEINK